MITDLGITKSDFENFAFEDFARDLIRIPITKTLSNISGAPTYTQGTSQTIKGIFTKRRTKYEFSKEGLLEMGDAFLQIKEDTELNKEDLIVVDDETFRVDEILLRAPNGQRFFKSVILFKQ
jgi:hypothetical protein